MTSETSVHTTAKPRVGYLHHVSFRVDDLESSLDFYIGLLGCTQLPRPEMGFRGAWLQLDDVQIHLLEVPKDETTGLPPTFANARANHVAFHVDEYDEFHAHLVSLGYTPLGGAVPSVKQMFVQDPSGNVIEFTPARR